MVSLETIVSIINNVRGNPQPLTPITPQLCYWICIVSPPAIRIYCPGSFRIKKMTIFPNFKMQVRINCTAGISIVPKRITCFYILSNRYTQRRV